MKAVPYTYTTPKWDYNPQTRRREKVGMEERTVEAASMFDVNKAIMRCLVTVSYTHLDVYKRQSLPSFTKETRIRFAVAEETSSNCCTSLL